MDEYSTVSKFIIVVPAAAWRERFWRLLPGIRLYCGVPWRLCERIWLGRPAESIGGKNPLYAPVAERPDPKRPPQRKAGRLSSESGLVSRRQLRLRDGSALPGGGHGAGQRMVCLALASFSACTVGQPAPRFPLVAPRRTCRQDRRHYRLFGSPPEIFIPHGQSAPTVSLRIPILPLPGPAGPGG